MTVDPLVLFGMPESDKEYVRLKIQDSPHDVLVVHFVQAGARWLVHGDFELRVGGQEPGGGAAGYAILASE